MNKPIYNPFQAVQESISDLKDFVAKQQTVIQTAPQKELFTFEEARIFLGVQKNTLYQYVSKRKIPYSKKFNKLYFSRSELIKWVLTNS